MAEDKEPIGPEEQLEAIMAEAVSRDLERAKRFRTIRSFTATLGVIAALAAVIFIFAGMRDLSKVSGIITGALVIGTGICDKIIGRAERRTKKFTFFGSFTISDTNLMFVIGAALILFYIILF